MPEPDERAAPRSWGCVHHPGVPRVVDCDVCGAGLCLACVVAVRGKAVGPECLGVLIGDPTAAVPPPAPAVPRSDVLAVAGFAVVVVLSFLPWSRFGDASGPLEAWTPHWSLPAVAAGTVGLVAAVATWRRPQDPLLEAALHLGLALLVAGAAFLHFDRPPPLSSPSPAPLFAIAGAGLAAASGALKGLAVLRLRGARASPRPVS